MSNVGGNETDDLDGDAAAKEHLAALKVRDRDVIKAKREQAQARERMKGMREYKRTREDERQEMEEDCGGMGEYSDRDLRGRAWGGLGKGSKHSLKALSLHHIRAQHPLE